MDQAFSVAKRIFDLLVGIKKSVNLTPDQTYALDEDITYMKKCLGILSTNDIDTFNDLWGEVQHMSHFFGGSYAKGDNRTRLHDLEENFFEAMKDAIIAARQNPIR